MRKRNDYYIHTHYGDGIWVKISKDAFMGAKKQTPSAVYETEFDKFTNTTFHWLSL